MNNALQTIHKNERVSIALIGLLVFNAVFVVSDVVYVLGFRTMVVSTMSMAMLLGLMYGQNRKISVWLFFLVLVSLITASITGIYWSSSKVYFYPANIGVSLLVVSIANKRELEKTVSIGSVILLVMLVGAWIAFFLVVAGVSSASIFVSAKGREIPYYYTSLAYEMWSPFGTMIRPSGIYDEPGTFSFVLCLFAFFRQMMGMGKRFTWSLLLFGFITFSIAHLVYVFVHLLSEQKIRKYLMKALLIVVLIIAALSKTDFMQYFGYALIDRLALSSDQDKIISGDNRSQNISHSFIYIKSADVNELLLGLDLGSIEGSGRAEEDIELNDNPLTPLIRTGFLISWPYYFFQLFALGFGAMRKELWPLFGVGLLFMQRPNVMNLGYAMLAALAVIIVLRTPSFKRLFKRLLGYRPSNYAQQQVPYVCNRS